MNTLQRFVRLQKLSMRPSQDGDTKIVKRRTDDDYLDASPSAIPQLGEMDFKSLRFHYPSDVVMFQGKPSQSLSVRILDGYRVLYHIFAIQAGLNIYQRIEYLIVQSHVEGRDAQSHLRTNGERTKRRRVDREGPNRQRCVGFDGSLNLRL